MPFRFISKLLFRLLFRLIPVLSFVTLLRLVIYFMIFPLLNPFHGVGYSVIWHQIHNPGGCEVHLAA